MKHQICCIGDGTIDTYLKIHNACGLCFLDQKECFLGLDFGSKIPVDELHQSVGGNAFNISKALAKLEVRCGLIGFAGQDEAGKKALFELERDGVDVHYSQKSGKTNQSVVIGFAGERTILSYKEKRRYHFKNIPKCPWYFLTSTGPGSEKFLKEFISNVKGSIIFNPGSYQLRMDTKLLKDIISKTLVLIVNLEEAQEISKLGKGTELKNLLKTLTEFGPRIVIITNGKEGAYAFDTKNFWAISSLPVKVVDPTGAGDSFSAAVSCALVSERGVATALLWGIFNSTSLIQKLGTEEGLLTKKELLELEKETELSAHTF